ncbi:MAG: LytTR family DNA-binding domain-containing protein [Luteolibacter sp.]
MSLKSQALNFLIVDDEELARTELRRQIGVLLPSFVALEAGNINQARELLLSHPIDGVFLDLEMPGGHGMSFLPEIRAMGVPVVVVTAHERFALDAFDGDAADYLLKPIESARLARALARVRRLELQADTRPGKRLIVLGDQSNCWPLHSEEIIMAESEGSYVMLHLKDRKPILLTRSLKEIEHLLDENHFVRANRSQIVQLQCLKQIRRQGSSSFTAELDGHGTIIFSRRQSQAFRQRFGF